MSSRGELTRKIAEVYVCSLYGMSKVNDVNEARFNKLVQLTGKISKENPMAKVKKVDCALLPPCGKTMWNKVQRAHYVSIIWGNADSPQPDQDLDPLQYGWKNENRHYVPDWFPGPAEPDNLFCNDHEEESIEIQENEDIDDIPTDDSGTDSGPEWSDNSDSESEA
ncbi:PREDICTED: uncharacterized protein LOC106817234 [Priapulus caudatus]|uniref:Uncharacterized protein LOC106817234 n=1 Tax=Priapulus caudatus TaxID=37621 RepID=A0ABM1EYW3_PRICU|nr:PREDICTED: uncharacterized protein LOC106817234 [Priapulus caudatus]